MIPTRSVGLACIASGLKTVMPPQSRGPAVGEVQLFGQRDDPRPVRTDMRSESSAMPDDGRLHLRAKVMITRHTLAAVHVAA